mmetsp:Transcript_18456/g.20525  ORF Transcript_18456/g.20525 Transcript_18456/m.20525 type:complete len:203 (-) Transcript_18456:177-785(-)
MAQRKRQQVKKACTNCRVAHAACAENRPCPRCVLQGLEHTCIDKANTKRAPRASSNKEFKSDYWNGHDDKTVTSQRSMGAPLLPTHRPTNRQKQQQQQQAQLQQQQNSLPNTQWPATQNGNTSPDNALNQSNLGHDIHPFIHQMFHTLNQKISAIEESLYLQSLRLDRVEESLTPYHESTWNEHGHVMSDGLYHNGGYTNQW